MNNVLKVEKGFVELCGFEDIDDICCFSFRSNELVISREKTGLDINEKTYRVQDRKIYDSALAMKLHRFCFSEAHSFIKRDEDYYRCEYNFIEDKLKEKHN